MAILPINEFEKDFLILKENGLVVQKTSCSTRRKKLKLLKNALWKYQKEIQNAMYNDFQKNPEEVNLSEIYPVLSEIKFTSRNLNRWMKTKRVNTPLILMGSSSFIQPQAKGIVLIISPWNFPINLTLIPLVSAIAAGNTVFIKTSEKTPHSSNIMKKIVGEVFDSKEVILVEGAIPEAQMLLDLPFNHIFFTGSPQVGKIIMKAAAKHLSSVTLELGGKSPCIIDRTANLKVAAKRIAWAKFLNAGQTCIAPDYILVEEKVKDEFVSLLEKQVTRMYKHTEKDSVLASMVNESHYENVEKLTKNQDCQALLKGGAPQKLKPTIIHNPAWDSAVMNNEIFGPILPVLTFSDIKNVPKLVAQNDNPLSFYIYSKSRKNIRFLLKNTRAGGVSINHSLLHFFNFELPFGGIQTSGIGKGHGKFGFDEFSNQKAIFKQWFPISMIDLVFAPFNTFKRLMINLAMRWF